jgi:RNA polymerase sigma factor (TIGR02999 family)
VLLDTVSLVHESYVKLVGTGQLVLADRQHFLAYAARTMRSIVVDELRRLRADKHGGGAAIVTLTTGMLDANPCDNVDALRIHEAMQELGEIDARLERIVELRFFAGLTEAETAAVLGVSTRTVQRDWEKARLFLSSVLES